MHCPIWPIPAMPINTNGIASIANDVIAICLIIITTILNTIIKKFNIAIHTFTGKINNSLHTFIFTAF